MIFMNCPTAFHGYLRTCLTRSKKVRSLKHDSHINQEDKLTRLTLEIFVYAINYVIIKKKIIKTNHKSLFFIITSFVKNQIFDRLISSNCI